MLTGDKGFEIIHARLNGLSLTHAGIVFIDPRVAKRPEVIVQHITRLAEKYNDWPALYKNTVFPL